MPVKLIAFMFLLVLGGCAEKSCNSRNDPGTPFNKAIAKLIKGDDSAVYELLEGGLDVNHRNACGATLLHIAAIVNNQKLAEYLLERDAQVNVTNWQNETPVFMAANWSSNAILEKLLKAGGNPNHVIGDDKLYNSPLMISAVNGNADGVKILLSNGANPDHKNLKGETPLSIAEQKEYADIIQLLARTQP